MQTLLDDIELDIQELKCLMQAILNVPNPALRIVAKRNIQQMKTRLDTLQELLDKAPAVAVASVDETHADAVASTPSAEPVSPVVHALPAEPLQSAASPASSILAERIKPAKSLRHAISLNDSFRFTKELFNGDAVRMNEVIGLLGEASSLDKAMAIFNSEVYADDENEAAADFTELLKKYFS